MKKIGWVVVLFMVSLALCGPGGVARAAVGKAAADFDNARPDKGETAWGRLVADALRASEHADIAIVNAGSLRRGTLKAGKVDAEDINGLLAFGDDVVVTLKVTGAQLRAALERAAQAYPTGSTAFLHCSGLVAHFNPQAPGGQRVISFSAQGHEIEAATTLTVAMPVSLAEGADGYFRIWKGQPTRSTTALQAAVADFIHAHGTVSPDNTVRFGP